MRKQQRTLVLLSLLLILMLPLAIILKGPEKATPPPEQVTSGGNSQAASGSNADANEYGDLIVRKEYDFPPSKVQQVSSIDVEDLGGGLFNVGGAITNNDSVDHGAIVSFRFLNKAGHVVGTAGAAVTEVPAGVTVPVSSLVTYDISSYKSVQAVVSDR